MTQSTTQVFLQTWPGDPDYRQDKRTYTKVAEFNQPVELITELIGGRPTRALEEVFVQLNVDEPEAPWAIQYRANRNPSLSVGDVVVIGECAYECAPVGWQPTTLTGGHRNVYFQAA